MNDTPLRVIRDRQGEAGGSVDRVGSGGPDCAAELVVQTTTVSSYPTSAASFFAVNPVQVNGAEDEGGAATYVADTSTVLYALNLGTEIPPSGTNLKASSVGNRLVVRYDG